MCVQKLLFAYKHKVVIKSVNELIYSDFVYFTKRMGDRSEKFNVYIKGDISLLFFKKVKGHMNK